MAKNKYLELGKIAYKVADDKQGEDIVFLNVRRLTTITDYFLIVSVQSHAQLKAISKAIEIEIKTKTGTNTSHQEGRDLSYWSVLDYGGLVIHIMLTETREFYALENIWTDARKVSVKLKNK